MARIAYDPDNAAAFAAARKISSEGLADWRTAIASQVRLEQGMTLLDLGSGVGFFAQLFTEWFGAEVVAVEPSVAMRERSAFSPVLAGDAMAIPLADASVDVAWLSTMVHHIPDLSAAAAELRRVLRPGGTVLIRSAFPGYQHEIVLFRYFVEAARVIDTFPSRVELASAFGKYGFAEIAFIPVPQVTSPSLAQALAGLDRRAHTPLQLITDTEFALGLERLQRAAAITGGPVIDYLRLMVLR